VGGGGLGGRNGGGGGGDRGGLGGEASVITLFPDPTGGPGERGSEEARRSAQCTGPFGRGEAKRREVTGSQRSAGCRLLECSAPFPSSLSAGGKEI